MKETTMQILKNHEDVLQAIAEAIDIPETLDQKARQRYQSIGEWLSREDSTIKRYNPEVSPQGSFLLGTVIRPVGDADQFDIDLVCKLIARKDEFTMESLKKTIGVEIVGYARAHNLKKVPEDGRRCWTLEYSDSANFHMDVLPALPDEATYRQLLERGGHMELANNQDIRREAIAITDKKHLNFRVYSDDWPVSNPKGYAVWFKTRQAEIVYELKRSIMEQELIYASIDDVPDHKMKTPLQRVIQLLKRHRDTTFEGDDDKPISIIITTLSAHTYNGETTIGAALRSILKSMHHYIEIRNGVRWISNPVNPEENFADKWVENPEKEAKFFKWLDSAQRHFGAYLTGNFGRIPDELQQSLTETTLAKVTPFIALSSPALMSSSDVGLEEANRIKNQGGATRPWRK